MLIQNVSNSTKFQSPIFIGKKIRKLVILRKIIINIWLNITNEDNKDLFRL